MIWFLLFVLMYIWAGFSITILERQRITSIIDEGVSREFTSEDFWGILVFWIFIPVFYVIKGKIE